MGLKTRWLRLEIQRQHARRRKAKANDAHETLSRPETKRILERAVTSLSM
jgi:hypothetical protein